MSRRVLARPLAAATVASALVLTTPVAALAGDQAGDVRREVVDAPRPGGARGVPVAAELGDHHPVVAQQRLEGLLQVLGRPADVMECHHQRAIALGGHIQINCRRK